jgi:trehalose 6-phosphate phosphatase
MGSNLNTRPSVLPAAAPNWALFLDIDGTLLDIAPAPEAVVVPPSLPYALAAAAEALGGALALVSGRPIAWIDRVFAPLCLPTAGQHGAEIRLAGDKPVQVIVKVPNLAPVRLRAAAIAAALPGVLLEEKTFGVALHYRSVPQAATELRSRMKRLVLELGDRFELLSGKMVLEIRSAMAWKERAVEAFMEVPPFAGRIPVFIGDDTTDHDAFRAARRRGGHAVQVGPGPEGIADWRVDGPWTVRDWLEALPRQLTREAR